MSEFNTVNGIDYVLIGFYFVAIVWVGVYAARRSKNTDEYFSGGGKSFRIRHDKIVSIQPYSDGVGIHRDAATAKPQVFATGDGWFTYNLLMNVSGL